MSNSAARSSWILAPLAAAFLATCGSLSTRDTDALELRPERSEDFRTERPYGFPTYGADVAVLEDLDGDGTREFAALVEHEWDGPSAGCTFVVHSGRTGAALAFGASPYRATTLRRTDAEAWLWKPDTAELAGEGHVVGLVVSGALKPQEPEAFVALFSLPSGAVLSQGIVRGTVRCIRSRDGGGGVVLETRDERTGEWVYRELGPDLRLGEAWLRSRERMIAAAENGSLKCAVLQRTDSTPQLAWSSGNDLWTRTEFGPVTTPLSGRLELQLHEAPDGSRWALVGLGDKVNLQLFDLTSSRWKRSIHRGEATGIPVEDSYSARPLSSTFLGDIDSDGCPDIALGARGSWAFCGSVFAVSGATGKRLWRWPLAAELSNPGLALALGDDWDRDGQADLVTSSSPTGSSGLAIQAGVSLGGLMLVSGRNGELLREVSEVGYPLAGQ
jgi:hypothetical protein